MNQTQWIELAAIACKDAGVKQDSIDVITTWEQTFTDNDHFRHNAVFRISDQRILKIYGTDALQHSHVERAVLETLNDQIPAPRLIATGTLERGSPYIIMSEIAGKTLQDTWADLSPSELRAIAREIGTITAQLHRQPPDKLAAVEAQFGGRNEEIKEMAAERIVEIEAIDRFSTRHKDELLEFLHGEARDFLDVPPVLTHADLSHAHIYIARENGQPSVSGLIDWAEAMLGPQEWDIAFHWLWTFSQDRDTMRECLNAYYQDMPRPERFARRCFATHLYTFSMREVWDHFTELVDDSESIVRAMVTSLFPPDVFGAPD
jgi:aminoglycoside phosphotransferase (APT) family kinase protein